MKLLDKYLFKLFFKNLLLVLAGLVAIYLLVDFFERIDNFLEAQKSLGLAARYFILKIPFIAEQIFPVSILLGGIVTLGLLNHHNELGPLKAGGLSVVRISAPLVISSLLYTFLFIAMAEWVLPKTMSVTNKIWHEQVHDGAPKGVYRNGRIYFKGSEGFYSFSLANSDTSRFNDFSYSSWDENHILQVRLTAKTASWGENLWNLREGQSKERTENGTYSIRLFEEDRIYLPENPAEMFIPEYKYNEMSPSQLYANARSASEQDKPRAWLEFHTRLSYIFLGIPLLLLGLPILLFVHQKWGRDLSLAIPASCALAFAAWGWWGVSQSLAKAEYIHPVPASWTVHLLIGALGVYLISRQDR